MRNLLRSRLSLLLALGSLLAACRSNPERVPNELAPPGSMPAGIDCPGAPLPAPRPADGTALPPQLRSQLEPLGAELATAMAAEDSERVATLVCQARALLGEYQGVAEAPAGYGTRSREPLEASALAGPYLQALESRLLGREPWVVVQGSTDGTQVSAPLREACTTVTWYLTAARFAPAETASQLREAARAGLSWLRSVQSPQGLFPFPDMTDDAEAYLQQCQAGGSSLRSCQESMPRPFELAVKAREAWQAAGGPPGALVNGWFVSDVVGDGGLQFDTGECGRALVLGWRELGDTASLKAARAAGRWARAQRAVTNWNYNAFSVGLLAELAAVDPGSSEDWAGHALRKARLGVLPGALPTGRWFDPHNARLVYHHIILRDLALLDAVVDDPWLTATLQAAHFRSARELAQHGSAGEDDGLLAHLLLRRLGYDSTEALAVLVQGSTEGSTPRNGGLCFWLADTFNP